MLRRKVVSATVVAVMVALQGCGGAGVTVLGAGAGTAAGTGISHTLSGVAYKTFTMPAERVRHAVLETLTKMEMEITGDKQVERNRRITAKAIDREISIDLEPLTPNATRMQVTVEENAIFKDAATATEIIVQTANALEEQA
ncbi:MAG: DUF3568 family protein [Rhodospirillales bacterium]